MRLPKESLDNFTDIDAKPIPAERPRLKLLRSSGKREVLKPIARSQDLARRNRFIRLAPLPGEPRFSWYHRSLAFSGALALAALILGIFAGLYSPTEPAGSRGDLALERQPEEILAQSEPDTSRLSPQENASHVRHRRYSVRATVKRGSARQRVPRSAPRRQHLAQPSHLVMSEFVPTTLIIYIENGEVKTRTEPQPTAGYKKRI